MDRPLISTNSASERPSLVVMSATHSIASHSPAPPVHSTNKPTNPPTEPAATLSRSPLIPELSPSPVNSIPSPTPAPSALSSGLTAALASRFTGAAAASSSAATSNTSGRSDDVLHSDPGLSIRTQHESHGVGIPLPAASPLNFKVNPLAIAAGPSAVFGGVAVAPLAPFSFSNRNQIPSALSHRGELEKEAAVNRSHFTAGQHPGTIASPSAVSSPQNPTPRLLNNSTSPTNGATSAANTTNATAGKAAANSQPRKGSSSSTRTRHYHNNNRGSFSSTERGSLSLNGAPTVITQGVNATASAPALGGSASSQSSGSSSLPPASSSSSANKNASSSTNLGSGSHQRRPSYENAGLTSSYSAGLAERTTFSPSISSDKTPIKPVIFHTDPFVGGKLALRHSPLLASASLRDDTRLNIHASRSQSADNDNENEIFGESDNDNLREKEKLQVSSSSKPVNEQFQADLHPKNVAPLAADVIAAANHPLLAASPGAVSPIASTPSPGILSTNDINRSAAERSRRHDLQDSLDAQKSRRRVLEHAILLFNEKPSEGMRYLIKQGMLEETPDAVADFLLNTKGLKKAGIGDYLGSHQNFNIAAMFSFVNALSFAGMEFVSALRFFLSKFRLPGEAQQIDRFMEKFAERYVRQNPNMFSHQDAAYLLAYSLIMLNTDAHSTKVKHKMTKKGFVKNCKELLRFGLTKDYLSNCFDEIQKNEIQLQTDYLEQLYNRVQVNNISAVKLAKRRRLVEKQERKKTLASKYTDQQKKIADEKDADGEGKTALPNDEATNNNTSASGVHIIPVSPPTGMTGAHAAAGSLPDRRHEEKKLLLTSNTIQNPSALYQEHDSMEAKLSSSILQAHQPGKENGADKDEHKENMKKSDGVDVDGVQLDLDDDKDDSDDLDEDLGDNSFFDLRRVAYLSRLTSGHIFIKYGRHGTPHSRRVWLSEDTRKIMYQDPEGKKKIKEIELSQIVDVTVGRNTTEVLTRSQIPSFKDHLCFSIITVERSLDLEAENSEDVHLWVNYLAQVAEYNRLTAQTEQLKAMRIQKENRAIQAINLWRNFVMPNSSSRKLNTRKKIRTIWLQGVPSCIRGRIWPKAIGNTLEISEELFQSFLQISRLNHTLHIEKKSGFIGLERSITCLQEDLPKTFPELQFYHEKTSQASIDLRDLLQTYIMYRPDIGYMRGMSHLAAMLLLYLDPLPAFVAFANLLHSSFFFAVCRLDTAQLTWRFTFFAEELTLRLPAIAKHFQQLNLKLEEFALEWFRSLFAKYLPLDLASRLWDFFLLDGEIAIWRTSLAILKYFERQLVRSTYDECLYLLSAELKSDELNEIEFWSAIDAMNDPLVMQPQKFFGLLTKNANSNWKKPPHGQLALAEELHIQ